MTDGTTARGRSVRWVGAMLALACVASLVSCSSNVDHPAAKSSQRSGSSGPVKVTPAEAASLRLLSGVRVDVPAGGVASPGVLDGAPASLPGPAPPGMVLDGPTYDLHVTGTKLTAPVTIYMPAPDRPTGASANGPKGALLAYFDEPTKAWVPVESTYDQATGQLVTQSPHLSLWSRLTVDTGALLGKVRDLLTGYLGAVDTVAQPSCPHEAEAKGRGVTVSSDSGNIVKWCVGLNDSGSAILRIANNRHYAVETDYPVNWTATRVQSNATHSERALNWVTQKVTTAPNGQKPIIIRGAETVEFTIPTGAGTKAHVTPSSLAYLLSALEFGGESLAMTLGQVPGAPKVNPSDLDKILDAVFSSAEFVDSFDKLIVTQVTDAVSAGELFRAMTDVSTNCVAKVAQAAMGASGTIAGFAFGVALWLGNGIKLVIDGVRAAIDSAIYWRTYTISVSSPPVPTGAGRFVGEWYVHGEQMVIKADGTGTLSANAGPCNDSLGDNMPMCEDQATFKGTLSTDGSTFKATITSVKRINDTTNQPDQGVGDLTWQLGETFSERFNGANYLLESPGGGNWCRPGATNDGRCGA